MAGLEGTKTDRQALTGNISVKHGLDGESVTITDITESAEDGGTNTVKFSDGSTLKIKNGSSGKNGADGNDGKSAYQYAQDGGYTGTEEEFALLMAQENLQTEKVSKLLEDIAEIITPLNLFNIYEYQDGYYINAATGVATENPIFALSGFIKVKPSTWYRGNFTNHIVYFDASHNFISGTNTVEYNITPENCAYVRFDWNKEIIQTKDIFFSEATVFNPNYDNELSKKMKLPQSKHFYKTENLFDFTEIIAGYYSDANNGLLKKNERFWVSELIKVEPDTVYTGNFGNHVVFFDENGGYISGYNVVFTFTTPSNCLYVRIDGQINVVSPETVMLVKGDTLPLEYIPPYVPTCPIPFNALYNIPENIPERDWRGKTWVAYGDSITSISNGNSLLNGWAKYVNNYHGFATFYGRGIGGQKYAWGTNGGSVSFINIDGTFHSRNDSYNKDNYIGEIPDGTVSCRGAFCSWDRITHMIPESIKDTIDLIYIMGGTNDIEDNTEAEFVPNDTKDTEWVESAYYSTYGGDFNISTLKGGVASTIMKMQAWCSNAVIVVGTPLSGRGTKGIINTEIITEEYSKAQIIKEITAKMSIPTIDVNATCGINGLNRVGYITDIVHPCSEDGNKMLAKSVIGGLITIIPKL